MTLSKEDATEIVNELSSLIGQKINIIGSDGIIIANSNPTRVGDFHEATSVIIQKHLDELVVVNDSQYEGTIAGTNLPLIIDGEIVGVVGVTGPHEVAKTYGKIVKRMTEMLISSRENERREMQQRQAFEHFCATWITSTQPVINDGFIEHGRDFGLDITKPHRIAIVSAANGHNEEIYELLGRSSFFQSGECYLFLHSHTGVVLIFPHMDDSHTLEQLHKTLECLKGKEYFVGVDAPGKSMLEVRHQYDQAKTALNAAMHRHKSDIVLYDDLCLELILDQISVQSKLNYIRKIFGDASVSDIERDMHTIEVLYEEDGSIKQAANRLIMHPNTLQYQLKRIEERTGYDPRKLRNAEIFGVAGLFFAELGDQLERSN